MYRYNGPQLSEQDSIVASHQQRPRSRVFCEVAEQAFSQPCCAPVSPVVSIVRSNVQLPSRPMEGRVSAGHELSVTLCLSVSCSRHGAVVTCSTRRVMGGLKAGAGMQMGAIRRAGTRLSKRILGRAKRHLSLDAHLRCDAAALQRVGRHGCGRAWWPTTAIRLQFELHTSFTQSGRCGPPVRLVCMCAAACMRPGDKESVKMEGGIHRCIEIPAAIAASTEWARSTS